MRVERIISALRPVVEVFEQLAIRYQIGGSVAASTFGQARSTLDVDLVAAVELQHAHPIADALDDRYYAEPELILAAVRERSCFNLIHLATCFKVDVFAVKENCYERAAFAREVMVRLGTGAAAREYRFSTPEDIILHKLAWFRASNESRERHWTDTLSLLRIQQGNLDLPYLDRWAAEVQVADLLARARQEAG